MVKCCMSIAPFDNTYFKVGLQEMHVSRLQFKKPEMTETHWEDHLVHNKKSCVQCCQHRMRTLCQELFKKSYINTK